MSTDPAKRLPRPHLAAYRALHEREEALARAIAMDGAFLEGTREMAALAEREGTAAWPTLDDLRQRYGLRR